MKCQKGRLGPIKYVTPVPKAAEHIPKYQIPFSED